MGDLGSIPGVGRSLGGGHGNPLQYSYWRIPGTEEPGGLQSMVVQSRTGRATKYMRTATEIFTIIGFHRDKHSLHLVKLHFKYYTFCMSITSQ